MQDSNEDNVFQKASMLNEANRRKTSDHMLMALAMMGVYSFVCLILYFIRSSFSEAAICSFIENDYLLYIWPPNGFMLESLSLTTYSYRQKCEFIAFRSVMSAGLIPFVIFSGFIGFKSRGSIYNNGEYFPFLFIFLIGSLTVFSPISMLSSKFSLSAQSSLSVNLIKSYIYIIGLYFSAYVMVGKIFSMLRSK